MEAEAWKALKQAAIRFELKTGIGQLKKTRYSRLDFKVIEILGAFIIVILTIKKDWMFMLPHVEVNDLFMSLRRLEKQTRMCTL